MFFLWRFALDFLSFGWHEMLCHILKVRVSVVILELSGRVRAMIFNLNNALTGDGWIVSRTDIGH